MRTLRTMRTLLTPLAAVLVLVLPLQLLAVGNATRIQLVGNVSTVPVPLTIASASASSGCCGFGPELAIDGSMSTRWGSTIGVDPAWLTLDMGSTQTLASVVIHWEAANADTYEIRGSNDNSNWTTLATETGGTFGDRTDIVAISGNYRYVQMYGISRSAGNMWGYSIWEIQVNGAGTLGPDADNDGVADTDDACAGTAANTPVKADGCPVGTYGGYDAPTSYPGLSLAWSDEFNGNALSADWTHDIGTGVGGWGNNELQYYRSQNTSVANGTFPRKSRNSVPIRQEIPPDQRLACA